VIHSMFRSAAGLAIAATATILIIAGSAAPVSAAETETFAAAPTIVIRTDGIDLASTAGVNRIKAEVNRAARRVCTIAGDRSLEARAHRQQCLATALNAAMPRLEALAAAARDARTDLADVPALTNTVRR
jgi:UrcA family protein